MRLSFLDKLLVVQSDSVGGEAHDVDHDDERLGGEVHALDALHHVQDFTEKDFMKTNAYFWLRQELKESQSSFVRPSV